MAPTITTNASAEKFFLATFLQYINKDTQVNIYKPYMTTEDQTCPRVQLKQYDSSVMDVVDGARGAIVWFGSADMVWSRLL